MAQRDPTSSGTSGSRPFLIFAVALAALLAWLFRDSFNPDLALFANDGPLGLVASPFNGMPAGWTRVWFDVNWLGFDAVSRPTTVNFVLLWLLGPRGFINFAPALTSFMLGTGIWLFCRTLRFSPAVCVLAGIAGALNSDFFSYGCWGLTTLTQCVAWVFVSLAALNATRIRPALRIGLAGAALGQALMEGFDNGAIFSLYIAAAAMLQAWWKPGAPAGRLGRGALATAGVAAASAVVASHILLGLIQTSLSGTSTSAQNGKTEFPAERWAFATQWSLPPVETLRAVVPGLFGYRMDTAEGGQYWGNVGSDLAWDEYWSASRRDPEKQPPALRRYSGAGHYAGVAVVLMALFGVAQLFAGASGKYRPEERRWVWFWTFAAVVSLLLAFGRFAPFYRLVHALPYFGSIRNPVKFLHPFNVALVVLAAYGLEALWRGWIARPSARPGTIGTALGTWWATAAGWERRWTTASLLVGAASILAWLVYGASKGSLLHYLGEAGFTATDAAAIARHSANEVGISVLFLLAGLAFLTLALSGWFGGGRGRIAALTLGALLSLDLARANIPWIIHYNWRERLARNDLFDQLRAAPHEGRLTGRLPFALPGQAGRMLDSLGSVFGVEWAQHQLPYFGVQLFDVVQLPRPPLDYLAHRGALRGNPTREWALTNTRYILGLAPLVEAMNREFGSGRTPFRVHTAFDLSQSPSGTIQVQTNATGPYALIEFTDALPRAMLYDRWKSSLDDDAVLQALPSTNFNPHAEVLVSEQIPAPAVETSSQPAGTAKYRSYTSTRFIIDTEARTPCVLLVNDHHDPQWKVRVDGREEPLLRANFVMRGVYLGPGKHEVEFDFSPSIRTLVVSLVAQAAVVVIAVFGLLRARRAGPETSSESASIPVNGRK